MLPFQSTQDFSRERMKRVSIIFSFFLVSQVAINSMLITTALAQPNLDKLEKELASSDPDQSLSDVAENLSLQDAINEGLRRNHNEIVRKYEFQLNEIIYKDAYDDYYYPKLNLTMGLASDHFAENLYRDNDINASSSKTPNGFVGLELKDYTVFNWGKDYLDFLNSKDGHKRTKENISESRRELRLDIINNYFNLSRYYLAVRIYKKQLSHTSFIYRLAKEKLTLRKINSQEFLQAKTLFLEAHKNYHESLYQYYQVQESMATLLGDGLKTIYKPLSILKYRPITFSSKESYEFVKKNGRNILDAKANMKISNRTYQRTLKDNLPLPKFSLKLGSYQRAFSSAGYDNEYNTFQNSKNIEIAATLNMSWRIYGSGGFFNSRKTETSFYNKKISEMRLREAHRDAEVVNHLTHARVLHLQKKYDAAEAGIKNARRVFDKAIDNYLASKTSFATLKQVLDELLNANLTLEHTKYEHLAEKLTLAKIMGVDDFPGQKFDNLVER